MGERKAATGNGGALGVCTHSYISITKTNGNHNDQKNYEINYTNCITRMVTFFCFWF